MVNMIHNDKFSVGHFQLTDQVNKFITLSKLAS